MPHPVGGWLPRPCQTEYGDPFQSPRAHRHDPTKPCTRRLQWPDRLVAGRPDELRRDQGYAPAGAPLMPGRIDRARDPAAGPTRRKGRATPRPGRTGGHACGRAVPSEIGNMRPATSRAEWCSPIRNSSITWSGLLMHFRQSKRRGHGLPAAWNGWWRWRYRVSLSTAATSGRP